MSFNKTLWPNLLEKALMKVYGGYKIRKLSPSSIVYNLTGWPPEKINLLNEDRNKLWENIYTGINNGEAIFILTSQDSLQESVIGIKSNSYYSILEAIQINDVKYLLLKNTYPNYYSGSNCERTSFKIWNDNLRKQCHFTNKNIFDSSVFWIEFNEIFLHFSVVDFNWCTKNYASKMMLFDIWKIEDIKNEYKQDFFSLKDNPQYFISFNIPKNYRIPFVEFKIIVSKLPAKHEDELMEDFLAIHLFSTKNFETIKYKENFLLKGFYLNDNHYTLRIRMDAASFLQQQTNYIIVLSSKGRKTDLKYSITLFSTCEIKSFTKINFNYQKTKNMEINLLKGISSGGNPLSPFFYRNYQYVMRFDPPDVTNSGASLKISLTGNASDSVNLFVFQHQYCKRFYLLPQNTISVY